MSGFAYTVRARLEGEEMEGERGERLAIGK
jgi:hypothetical protein